MNTMSIFLICFLLTTCNATNRSVLFKHIFKNYEVDVAPYENASQPLDVTMYIYLQKILDVRARQQIFESTFWFFMSWKDDRLAWNPEIYKGIDSIHTTSSKVWNPAYVCMVNDIGMESCFREGSTVTVLYTGEVIFSKSLDGATQCNINAKKYPFDVQKCSIDIGSAFHKSKFIHFNLTSSYFGLDLYSKSEEWSVVNTSVSTYSIKDFHEMIFEGLHFEIVIERQPGSVIVSYILPVMLLSIVNLCSFVLPSECGEKMGTSVAIFLTFAVFLTFVSQFMPVSEDTPHFTIYLTFQLVLSGLVIIMETIVLKYKFDWRENLVGEIQMNENNESENPKISKDLRRHKINIKYLDRYMMIIYLILNLISILIFFVGTQ
ncbi:neuronal acetylcholine receptor subunit alpha-3-like [Saccostrea cucullata]|uniref:neuronal acetylcholine receptor subunit alpha-3-like n=1 Tax=Saccostrea cuccullata TaxID=36930 RepID=UPI002ED5506F